MVSMATFVVAVLHPFVNTARYCLPLSPAAATKLYVFFIVMAWLLAILLVEQNKWSMGQSCARPKSHLF